MWAWSRVPVRPRATTTGSPFGAPVTIQLSGLDHGHALPRRETAAIGRHATSRPQRTRHRQTSTPAWACLPRASRDRDRANVSARRSKNHRRAVSGPSGIDVLRLPRSDSRRRPLLRIDQPETVTGRRPDAGHDSPPVFRQIERACTAQVHRRVSARGHP